MDRKTMVRTRSNSRLASNTMNGGSMSSSSSNGASATGTGTTTGTRTRHKSGNASYADLITRAILSSNEKRLTLSEIYDWMVDNVPGLKDQRYLHSAKGWKNAVRHTLSINPRFRKMARLGRPGWWTVDPDFVRRTSVGSNAIPPPSTPPFATTAAFIWEAPPSNGSQQNAQNQAAFRGRLASAPAVFLQPIFATANPTAASNASCCYSSPSNQQMMSRPPSSMSLISGTSTPISSPTSAETAFTAMSPQMGHPDGNTQTVQIWRDQGGVGVVSVPRPLPMRVASVTETGTQTEENQSALQASGISVQRDSISGFNQFRNVCDLFENVSPVASPLTANTMAASPAMAVDQAAMPQQEQTQLMDPHQNNDNVRISLAQHKDGRPILIFTNMTTTISNGKNTSPVFTMPTTPAQATPIQQVPRCEYGFHMDDTLVSPVECTALEELPEDLEGIDVDPNVRCDVVEVIQYEQNFNRVPKVEGQWR